MLLGFAVLSPAEFYFSCLLLCCKILTQVTGAVLKRLFLILYHSCRLVTRKVTSCFTGVYKVYCIWEIKISSALCRSYVLAKVICFICCLLYWLWFCTLGFIFKKNEEKGPLKNIKKSERLMQASSEHNFEYRPLLTEIYCLEKVFDHRKRTCDPQNLPLFSMESIDRGTDIISNKRPYLSSVHSNSRIKLFKLWMFGISGALQLVRSCVAVSQLTSGLIPLFQNLLKFHKLIDGIIKYADVQAWFICLDHDHSSLTSAHLCNVDSKSNRSFIWMF